MRETSDWVKVAKYITGNCSAEEKAVIEKKMKSDDNFRSKVREARQAWELSTGKLKNWDIDKAWYSVLGKLSDNERAHPIKKTGTVYQATKKSSRFSTNYLVRVAAAILVVVISSIIFYQSYDGNIGNQIEKKTQTKLVAEQGEQKSFHLSDGTKITLAPDSKIRLSSEYVTGTREVYLEGEAYFDVTTDNDHPFKVYAKGTVTEVLGTQFNITSYPQDQSVQVVVVEGGVGLKAIKTHNQILLKPGELGSYTSDQSLSIQKVDVNTFVDWKNGKLIFDDQPLEQIVVTLERWYDLPFSIDSSEIKGRKLTATFARRQPLGEILDAIALTLDINYSRQNDSVHFKQKQ